MRAVRLRHSGRSQIIHRTLEIAVDLREEPFDRTPAHALGLLVRSLRIDGHSGLVLVFGIVALAERLVKTIVGIGADRIGLSQHILPFGVVLDGLFVVEDVVRLRNERIEHVPRAVLTPRGVSPVGSYVKRIVIIEPAVALAVLEVVLAHQRTDQREAGQSGMLRRPVNAPAVGVHQPVNAIHGALSLAGVSEYFRTRKRTGRSPYPAYPSSRTRKGVRRNPL